MFEKQIKIKINLKQFFSESWYPEVFPVFFIKIKLCISLKIWYLFEIWTFKMSLSITGAAKVSSIQSSIAGATPSVPHH